ncbi:hypothetical protein ACRZTK_004410 [Enterobacter asburiae]
MDFRWPEQLQVRLYGIRHQLSVVWPQTVDEDGMLQGFACQVQPDCHGRHFQLTQTRLLAAATRTDLVRLMQWQFSGAREYGRKYGALPLGIRVQVSLPAMQLCLHTSELMACLQKGAGVLALETTGPLGEAGYLAVSQLSCVCPVWLGQYGVGDAGLLTALAAPFSGVVISPALQQEVQLLPEGVSLLRAQTAFLAARGRLTVVCGNSQAALLGCGVAGFQDSSSGK